MDLGDIIVLGGTLRLVVRLDDSGHAYVSTSEGEIVRVADNLDLTDPGCVVRCNPYRSWPFVLLPHARHGRVTGAALPDKNGDLHWLTLFEHYLVGEPIRTGGALHLNPILGLRYPSRVFIRFERGQTSVIIPRRFTPVARKGTDAQFRRLKNQGPRRLTVYDHLLGDTLGEDE